MYKRQAYTAQNIKVFTVIGNQIRTRFWCKALFTLTKSMINLKFTRRLSEIGSRTADIVNIAFKILKGCKEFCLFNNAFLASRGNISALMKLNRAEITRTVTATIMSNRKLDLLNTRNAALTFINRMICTHIRQIVNIVKFFSCQRRHRNILNNHKFAVFLADCSAPYMILLVLFLALSLATLAYYYFNAVN